MSPSSNTKPAVANTKKGSKPKQKPASTVAKGTRGAKAKEKATSPATKFAPAKATFRSFPSAPPKDNPKVLTPPDELTLPKDASDLAPVETSTETHPYEVPIQDEGNEEANVINLTEDDEEEDEESVGGEEEEEEQEVPDEEDGSKTVASPDKQEEEDMSDLELDQEGQTKFVTHYWDGQMPAPTGQVAKLFAKTPVDMQFAQVESLIRFNPDEKPTITIGDFSQEFTPFLVAVPGRFRKVKVVYAMQSASIHDIFKDTEVEKKVLALTGELVPGVLIPNAMVFPPEITKARKTRVPEGQDFAKKRRDAMLTTKSTWFVKDKVDRIGDIPPAIPVPAVLVYDAFDREIDAMIVYERLKAMPTQTIKKFTNTIALTRNFLKAQTVAATKKSKQTYLDPEVFLATPPILVNEWKKEVLKHWFPTPTSTIPSPQQQNNAVQQIPVPSNATEATTSIVVQAVHTYERMRAEEQTANGHTTNSRFSANNVNGQATTTETEANKATCGLPVFGFNRLLLLCGLVPGEEDQLPKIWPKLALQGMTKSDKKSVIKLLLEEEVWYKDAKVQSYTQLVTMIMKRDFEEDTSMSSRKSAAKGLTIFAVPTMSDVEFDRLNEMAAAIEEATQTTVKDITSASFEAQSPKSYFQLVKLIKRFANLLFALFGAACPLFVELESLVGFLEEYGDTAINNMSTRTMASIAWIIHLQARYFAKGNMKAPRPLLTAFVLMLSDIQTRREVMYGDVPLLMYQTTVHHPRTNDSNHSMGGGNGHGGKRKHIWGDTEAGGIR